ncbi:hypothetical protein B0H19DRAFT_1257211 [Mycena capillaripes]|nr:hypothetical protein B0H19DRAFT_1257211 [Mycena capillaripes]
MSTSSTTGSSSPPFAPAHADAHTFELGKYEIGSLSPPCCQPPNAPSPLPLAVVTRHPRWPSSLIRSLTSRRSSPPSLAVNPLPNTARHRETSRPQWIPLEVWEASSSRPQWDAAQDSKTPQMQDLSGILLKIRGLSVTLIKTQDASSSSQGYCSRRLKCKTSVGYCSRFKTTQCEDLSGRLLKLRDEDFSGLLLKT